MYDVINGYETSADDTQDVVSLRPSLIRTLIRLDDSTAISDGLDMFESDVVDCSDEYLSSECIDANLITSVLSAAFADGDRKNYELIVDEIYPSASSTKQSYILSALGATYTKPSLLTEAVSFVLSDNVRSNERISGLYSCRRCSGRFEVWRQLTANNSYEWNKLAKFYPSFVLVVFIVFVFLFLSDVYVCVCVYVRRWSQFGDVDFNC